MRLLVTKDNTPNDIRKLATPAGPVKQRPSAGSYAAIEVGGPSLAGLLVQAVGAAVCLLMDAVSYVISAILVWTLPYPA